MKRIKGNLLTPQGFVAGTIEFGRNGRIARIEGDPIDADRARETGQPLVLPGFIDLHVHGGAGADVMDGGDAIDRIGRLHARHGTTAMLATTVTADVDSLRAALGGIRKATKSRAPRASRVLGVHLEGPYINPDRLGAQPGYDRPADLAELLSLHEIAPIRVVTLAPELSGHLQFVRQLKELGIVAQCGHSAGSYEDGVAALMAGVKGFTHLFNAMSPMHHRQPGMVGAALAHAKFAEVIPDLLHVHPGAVRAALRAIPHLYCVTDSTAAAGMPDGEYRLGTHTVTKCMGGVRLSDGTLAGSTLTMDQALRNLVGIGVELDDAARRLSTYPADYIGELDRGRLEKGRWADVLVFGSDLNLKEVYVEGERIALADA
jgi:N-acetylglucosamine-6-phosphate deacetylase